ncbi:MAG: metal-dependent transcriptional regulator [Pirellulales bacterium]|nr:metal-dependent transcriptional regulator [Pirellulales bacterium]
MPSLTVENYVKAIYQICGTDAQRAAATGELAAALGVLPGTVTSMLKTLSAGGLVTYTPYEGVRLTTAGEALAVRVVRRHRLIEQFLVETLKLTWDEVHEEAEHMEHAVSDWLVDRIDEFLGRPDVDPHGDPIPRADGSIEPREVRALGECSPGFRFQLARVIDQTPDFLRYLTESGLRLGAEGEVKINRPEADVITVDLAGRETTLGHVAANKLLVLPR